MMNTFADTPVGRRTRADDPVTSKLAAASSPNGGWKKRVYDAVCTFGPAGCIADDIKDFFGPDVPHVNTTGQWKYLIDDMKLFVIGTRTGRSGKLQRVYVADIHATEDMKRVQVREKNPPAFKGRQVMDWI